MFSVVRSFVPFPFPHTKSRWHCSFIFLVLSCCSSYVYFTDLLHSFVAMTLRYICQCFMLVRFLSSYVCAFNFFFWSPARWALSLFWQPATYSPFLLLFVFAMLWQIKFSLSLSLSPLSLSLTRYFETNKPVLMQIGTSGSGGRGMKRSTLEVRRSKFNVTRGRRRRLHSRPI